MTLIETIVSGIAGLWLGSMEYRMRKVREDANKIVSRHDVSELIDLKAEASLVRHKELKENLAKVETKIDKLIDLQIKK